MSTLRTVLAGTCGLLLLTGCGGNSDGSTASSARNSSTSVVTQTTPPAEPSTTSVAVETTAPSVARRMKGDSAGLALKLISTKKKPSITYTGNTISDVTPKGDDVTLKAAEGYYLYVQMDGKNGTKEPIDLTCSFPIDVRVFDEAEARYTPIESLGQIKGNPGCNDNTQPGQRFKETFIFLMPAGSKPMRFEWESINSGLERAETATIDLAG